MVRSTRNATVGFAAALILIGITSSAQGFASAYSSLTRGNRQIQLAGKLVCTNCSLEEARKTRPRYSNHLYRVAVGEEQAVMEVQWVSYSTWLHHLMAPQIRLQGEEQLLLKLTAQDNLRKDFVVSATLTDAQTLTVKDVNIYK